MTEATLFDPEDLIEWVVEINEILLNSTGAQGREPMEWWAIHSGRPGIVARTIHLFWAPPGMLLYLKCDDQEEAEFIAEFLVLKGLHPKGVTVRQLGRPITCKGCGERRPLWVRGLKGGSRCRPCWTEWADYTNPSREAAA
jgi:hypothetical protein